MAVKETEKQPRDLRPWIFGIVLLVVLAGAGAFVYWMVKGPQRKLVTLSGEPAKQADQPQASPTPRGPPAPALATPPPIALANDPGPTLVTLELKGVTPQEAVAALAKAANVSIDTDASARDRARAGAGGSSGGFLAALLNAAAGGAGGAAGPTTSAGGPTTSAGGGGGGVNLSINHQPFWLALREVRKQANLSVSEDYNNRERITLASGANAAALNCPTVSSGSCLIVLERITSYFNAALGASGRPGAGNSLTVSLKIYVEPRLAAYRITPIATIESAVDEKGNSLLRPRDPWDDRNSGGPRRSWMSQVECLLKYPARAGAGAAGAGARIARLKGYVSVMTAGKEETIKLKDPLKLHNSDQKIGEQALRVVEVRQQGPGNYQARFLGDANSPCFKDWENLTKVAALLDGSGTAFEHGGTGMGGGPRGMVEFSLYFNRPAQPPGAGGSAGAGEPVELDITLPGQIREIRVPFEFSDLPLPD